MLNLSAFSEQMLIHEHACVAIDKDMPLDRAAVIGCAVTTGAGAIFNACKVVPGETVAVIGCGGVGLATVNAARIAGAGRVIAAVGCAPVWSCPAGASAGARAAAPPVCSTDGPRGAPGGGEPAGCGGTTGGALPAYRPSAGYPAGPGAPGGTGCAGSYPAGGAANPAPGPAVSGTGGCADGGAVSARSAAAANSAHVR